LIIPVDVNSVVYEHKAHSRHPAIVSHPESRLPLNNFPSCRWLHCFASGLLTVTELSFFAFDNFLCFADFFALSVLKFLQVDIPG
jgi:hypothetical protein